MNRKTLIVEAITSQGLLPLFYHDSAAVSLEVIRSLYAGGVRVVEYTNRGNAALKNFILIKEVLKTEMEGLHFGIGTVKNVQEAKDFMQAGADFIVCPVADPAVGNMVHNAGLLWIPGCLTPTEINLAYQMHAGIIKLFPANILGPAYVAAIRDIFPGQKFIPTGGVEIEKKNLKEWFSAGVCAVGMGSKLITSDILINRDYTALLKETKRTLELINTHR